VAWVLGNHDRVRIATRFGGGSPGLGHGDRRLGLARARAAALLHLALPGPVYLYQGDELGLPEVVDLPDEAVSDPIFRSSNGARRGRDGCRGPLPWAGRTIPFGFSPDHPAAVPWLPQPPAFVDYSIAQQRAEATSTLHLYRYALALRRNLRQLGDGELRWLDLDGDLLAFSRGEDFLCAVNFGDEPVPAPAPGPALLCSRPLHGTRLPGNTAAWWLHRAG
jgi:alpha-glucosidase